MIPETCPDHIPLKSLCCYFCPTKAQIRTYLTVLDVTWCIIVDLALRLQ